MKSPTDFPEPPLFLKDAAAQANVARQLVTREPPPFSPAALYNELNQSSFPRTEWKRLRIAMTQAEYDAYRAWWFETKESLAGSICGVKIVIEDRPGNPTYTLEYRE